MTGESSVLRIEGFETLQPQDKEPPPMSQKPISELRRRMLEDMAVRDAPSSSRAPSSTISRTARSTVARLPIHALENGAVSGRHRRQGRNPAASAAAADGKNWTLVDLAGRTGQTGRQ